MSDVDRLKRSYAAYNRGDVETALESAHNDLHADLSERVFNPAILDGKEEFRRDFQRLAEAWEEFRYEPDEFFELSGGRTLVTGHIRGRGRGSGVDVELFSAHLWAFEAGEAVSMKLFRDRDAALEAAGLRPEPGAEA